MSDVEEAIADIIVANLAVDRAEITPASRFQEDLMAGSLEIIELIMSVEETFGIEVPDEEAERLRTVGDLVAFVDRRQPSGNKAPAH